MCQGGWTPLHVAAKEGSKDMVKLLLLAKADIEAATTVILPDCICLKIASIAYAGRNDNTVYAG